MRHSVKHTFLSWFLLTIMSGYLFSIVTFTHVHTIDGVRIVHSHPFKDAHHQHSPQQTILFHALTHYDCIVPCPSRFNFDLWLSGGYAYAESILSEIIVFTGSSSALRAPPVSC